MKQGWEIKKLEEVCEVITKGTTPTSLGFKFTDEGVNFIKVESLTESGQIIPNKVAYISEECHESLKRSQLKENDILFSIAGALGRIGIVNKEIVPANTNQALAIVRLANNSGISVNFLAKYFISNIISEEIEKLKGGAAQQNLSLGQLNNLSIPLPPLPEQQRIVAILDEAFTAIAKAKANAEQNLKNAKELFESYLQGVFENKGDDWDCKKLKELYQIGSSKRVLKSQWKTEGIPFYRGREITKLAANGFVDNELYISEEHFAEILQKTGVPKAGDIVMTAIGTIGNTHIVRDFDKFYFKDASVLWLKRFLDTSSEFTRYFLKSSLFFNQLDQGNGATVDTLTIDKLQNIELFIPALKTQQNIVQKLDALSTETKKLEAIYQQKINDLEELKKSVLQKAFSGELKTEKALV